MSEVSPKNDDEIELVDLLSSIWQSKWLISSFIFFAVLFGVGLNLSKDAVYKSKFLLLVDTLPPFISEYKASLDFYKMFHSKIKFNDWKKDKKSVSIVYDDFSLTQNINGFVMSKNKDDNLAILNVEKDNYNLTVMTKDLKLLEEFFNYANYINDMLKSEYILRAKKQLDTSQKRAEDGIIRLFISGDNITNTIDMYIDTASKEARVFTILNSTMPKKISYGLSLILPLSIILGLMGGVFFILVRNLTLKLK